MSLLDLFFSVWGNSSGCKKTWLWFSSKCEPELHVKENEAASSKLSFSTFCKELTLSSNFSNASCNSAVNFFSSLFSCSNWSVENLSCKSSAQRLLSSASGKLNVRCNFFLGPTTSSYDLSFSECKPESSSSNFEKTEGVFGRLLIGEDNWLPNGEVGRLLNGVFTWLSHEVVPVLAINSNFFSGSES